MCIYKEKLCETMLEKLQDYEFAASLIAIMHCLSIIYLEFVFNRL